MNILKLLVICETGLITAKSYYTQMMLNYPEMAHVWKHDVEEYDEAIEELSKLIAGEYDDIEKKVSV